MFIVSLTLKGFCLKYNFAVAILQYFSGNSFNRELFRYKNIKHGENIKHSPWPDSVDATNFYLTEI